MSRDAGWTRAPTAVWARALATRWPPSWLGRTGRFLALDHWGVEPDLITLSNALSGGYVPTGAVLRTDRTSVQLNPDAYTTEVAEFEAALAQSIDEIYRASIT